MEAANFRKLSQLRAFVEGFGARHAAESSGADQVEALQGALQFLKKSVRQGNYSAFRKADAQLHETIMNMSAVPHLREVWQLLWDALAEFHAHGFREYVPDPRTIIGEHEYLVQTIVCKDPSAAEDAARCHVEANWARMNVSRHAAEVQHDPIYLAASYVGSHLHCTLRLKDIASQIAFTSAGHLSRLFRQKYGMGFNAHLQKLRMEKAVELLETTSLLIGTIALRVGYRDASRFVQHFERRYRMSPRQWRKKALSGKKPARREGDFVAG